MEHFVVDNKRAKILRAIGFIFALPPICALPFVCYMSELAYKALVIGTFIGLVTAIISFFVIPTVRIVVSDTRFTIKTNRKEESYSISRYAGPEVTREYTPGGLHGGKWKTVRSWVFRNGGYVNKVECTDLSPDAFRRISDALRVRQYKMLHEGPVKEGKQEGSYEGTYTQDIRIPMLAISVVGITSLLIVLMTAIMHPQIPDAGKLFLRGLCIFVLVASVIFCVVQYIFGKINNDRMAKMIKVDRSLLNINDESYEVANIKELYMTQPYIRDRLPAVRSLVFIYRSEKKPFKYMIELRPDHRKGDDSYYKSIYNTVISICNSRGIRILEDEPRALAYANPRAFRRRT